jgi:argininosuccinate lyase
MRKQRASEYRGYRTAGIRLTEEILPSLLASETPSDTLRVVHQFDKAHAVMLTEEGIIPRSDGIRILAALRELEDGDVVARRLEAGGGEHSGEQVAIRKLGEEVGGRLHLGRSSGDIVIVSSRMFWRDRLLRMIARINEFRDALLETGERNLETVMPGYTHGLSAQPTTYGHQLLAWELALARDVERARGAYQRVNVSPAGAAILTGSSFPMNRHRTSELLGFDRPGMNTFDCILQHDDELEVASVLAIHSHNMARAADDLMFWSASEMGMIDVPDRFCGTSSIMMQKKNPYTPENLKGSYADAVGGLVTAFLVEKGPTGMPIVEREYAAGAIERQFTFIIRNLDWMIEMVPEIKPKVDVMLERAGAYWAQGTDLAAALVNERDMNWRSAHQIVGICVRYTEERGLSPHDVTPELLDEAAVEYMGEPVNLGEDVLRAALDPREFVAGRLLYGGPAPAAVRERLPDHRAQVESDRRWVAEQTERLQQAEQSLERAIDDLVAA